MPAHTLTLRLDEETNAALEARCAEDPKKPIAEVIREAILERGACVYFVRRSDGAVKIGFTGAMKVRLGALRAEVGDVTLEAAMPGGRAEEKALHAKHKKARLTPKGEWFRGVSVEAEIQEAVATWGAPDVDQLGGAGRYRVWATKLSVEESALLTKFLEARNAEAKAKGYGLLTASAFIRTTLLEALDNEGYRLGQPIPSGPSQPVVANGKGSHGQGDEVVMRPGLPSLRPGDVRAPEPVPETPVEPPLAAEPVEAVDESGDDELGPEAMEAFLRGSPL